MKTFLLTMCAIPLILSGAEWHVSKSGNDGNPGTAEQPFAKIATAVAKAQPGDTIRLAPGVYREAVMIRKSGTKEAPITLRGTRGPNGDYLSVVEGIGAALANWEAAPEIASGVWKTKLEKRPDLVLMDGKMIASVNAKTMELPRWKELPSQITDEMLWSAFGPDCKRLPGLDLLALSHDVTTKIELLRDSRVSLWEVLKDVLAGWKDGMLYVRLADGGKPESHAFTASYGNGFTLYRASYWNFNDLCVRGSRYQFRLEKECDGIKIGNSLLMHGGARVFIARGAANTLVQNNILTSGFIQSECFGLRSAEDMRGGLLYKVFKLIIGTGVSDDVAVIDRGTNTKIFDNVMVRGLVGIDAYGQNCEFARNVVREMSSVGICTMECTVGKFHHNLVMNCGIPLRFHHMRHTRDKREEYHYCNLFVQAPHAGSMTYLHSESQDQEADKENFEPGTSTYKKNPPNPVDAGKFFIYHNTFWGGDDWLAAVDLRYKANKFRMSLPFYIMNNIMKYTTRQNESRWPRFTLDYQDALVGNLFYRNIDRPEWIAPEEAEVGRFNRILEKKDCPALWSGTSLAGLPDVTLNQSSPAVACGVDLSKTQVINGKPIPAMPGMEAMKPKPDAGALQLGQSQKAFVDMHQRAERTISMLRGAQP